MFSSLSRWCAERREVELEIGLARSLNVCVIEIYWKKKKQKIFFLVSVSLLCIMEAELILLADQ